MCFILLYIYSKPLQAIIRKTYAVLYFIIHSIFVQLKQPNQNELRHLMNTAAEVELDDNSSLFSRFSTILEFSTTPFGHHQLKSICPFIISNDLLSYLINISSPIYKVEQVQFIERFSCFVGRRESRVYSKAPVRRQNPLVKDNTLLKYLTKNGLSTSQIK